MDEIEVELQDIVDTPRETERVELKNWLDLTSPENRASIARHLAALANYGGGYVVFGFEDDGRPSSGRPASLVGYSREAIAGVVERYLTPKFPCRVPHVERLSLGEIHPVAIREVVRLRQPFKAQDPDSQ